MNVKTWLIPAVVAIVTIGAIVMVVRLQATPPAQAQEQLVFVPGQTFAGGFYYDQELLKSGAGIAAEQVKQAQALGEPDVVFRVKLRRAEFDPAEFRVKKGQVVKFILEAEDNGLADMPEVDPVVAIKEFSGHGFGIGGNYGVWVAGIRKDTGPREITFKATQAGEFDIDCVVFCSPDHYLMTGKFIVEE